MVCVSTDESSEEDWTRFRDAGKRPQGRLVQTGCIFSGGAVFQEYFRVANKESSVRFRKKEVTGSFLLVFTSFIYIAFFKKMFNTVQMKP